MPTPPCAQCAVSVAHVRRLVQPLVSRPWLAFAAVFAAAIWQRAALPWLPLADPDTWGYLNPALQHLAGAGLVQSHCRSMAYPVFLLAVLRASGNFQAIAVAQHVLGLGSGLMWIVAFRCWLAWLPGELARSKTAWWFASLCLAAYLCNPATLVLESQIRPEGVFPFFSLAQIAATLCFLRALGERRSVGVVLPAAAAATLLAVICLSLKPSWGLAALVPFAAVGWGVFFGPARLSTLTRAGLVAACAIVLTGWNFLLPPLLKWIPETDAGRHLAGTLFTIHADIISREMHARAARGALDAEEKFFLERLDETLQESRGRAKPSWTKALGFDADYILFQSGLLGTLPHTPASDPEAHVRYEQKAYLRAVFGQPRMMASKILHQLSLAYNDASLSLFRPAVPWRALFGRSNKDLHYPNFPKLPKGLTASIREAMTKIDDGSATQPEMLAAPCTPPRKFLRGMLTWYLVALVAAGGVAIFVLPWLGGAPAVRAFRPALGAFAVIWLCSTGSALTVAIIHCFAIRRYLELQSSIHALLLATGTILLFSMVSMTLRSRFQSLPPNQPENP